MSSRQPSISLKIIRTFCYAADIRFSSGRSAHLGSESGDLLIQTRPLGHNAPRAVQLGLLGQRVVAQIDRLGIFLGRVAAPCFTPQPLLQADPPTLHSQCAQQQVTPVLAFAWNSSLHIITATASQNKRFSTGGCHCIPRSHFAPNLELRFVC